MEEAKASWNTVYQSKEGFECQITLRDESETNLADRSCKVMASITKSGGVVLKRRSYIPEDNGNHQEPKEEAKEEIRNGNSEKTYVDAKGVRRCNLKLNSGKVCGAEVTQRQGRYGPFWSCPDYKKHAA